MLKIIFCLILSATSLCAWSTEHSFGLYRSKHAKIPITFTLEDTGISGFRAFGRAYRQEEVFTDFLGMSGSSEILQIKFTDNHGAENMVKLFLVIINNKMVMVTGYFHRFRLSADNTLNTIQIEPIEFRYLSIK